MRDELLRLIEDLPDEDLDWVVGELRDRADRRSRLVLDPNRPIAPLESIMVVDSLDATPPERQDERRQRYSPHARWPGLGPGAVGTAVLLGWAAGALGGPLVAMLGAALGFIVGDQLDQRNALAADA